MAAVARIVGEHDTRLWRVIHHYVEQAPARMDAADVTNLAIDETQDVAGPVTTETLRDVDRLRLHLSLAASTGREIRWGTGLTWIVFVAVVAGNPPGAAMPVFGSGVLLLLLTTFSRNAGRKPSRGSTNAAREPRASA